MLNFTRHLNPKILSAHRRFALPFLSEECMTVKKNINYCDNRYCRFCNRHEEPGENPEGICHSGSTANSQSVEEDSHSS